MLGNVQYYLISCQIIVITWRSHANAYFFSPLAGWYMFYYNTINWLSQLTRSMSDQWLSHTKHGISFICMGKFPPGGNEVPRHQLESESGISCRSAMLFTWMVHMSFNHNDNMDLFCLFWTLTDFAAGSQVPDLGKVPLASHSTGIYTFIKLNRLFIDIFYEMCAVKCINHLQTLNKYYTPGR